MPITKALTRPIPTQVITAGTQVQGATDDFQNHYGGAYTVRLENGATGPATPPEVVVEVSMDDAATEWIERHRIAGRVVADEVTSLVLEVEPQILFARVRIENTDGQSITAAASLHRVTTIG